MECRIDDKIIEYKITGEGDKWVTILQGWGTTYGLYDSIAGLLAPGYRVLQFDLPGFGYSEEPEHPFSVSEYADWCLKLFSKLGISKTILIGHSYGGRIILHLASRDRLPVEIEKLVFIDAAGVLPKRTKAQLRRQRRYKRLKRIAENPIIYQMFPDLIDDWKSRQGSEDYRNASPLMKKALVMAVNEDLCDKMPLIYQETLLIWGDKDTATPLSDGETFNKLIPNSTLRVLEGTGHFSYAQRPAEFGQILLEFLPVGRAKGGEL
ncbi:MAG: alpha/beta hydrolase [Lachnospiraceae bacterium]|nr:alpha/beta hydrolase [Lachnospiraceae bacterium]